MKSEDSSNRSTRDGLIRSGEATLLFALWHSFLASATVKKQIKNCAGDENFAAFYRVFYNVQAVITTGALLLYILRQPGKTLYETRGWKKYLMRAGQLFSISYGAWAAAQLPLSDFSGVPHLLARLRGQKVPREPEAQGPTVEENGKLRSTGPFRINRHPLNWAPLGVFWLQPKMTTNWLLFNILVTLYDFAGSKHEEARLTGASPDYEKYRRNTPFFWPKLKK